jgi:hypothetical protein
VIELCANPFSCGVLVLQDVESLVITMHAAFEDSCVHAAVLRSASVCQSLDVNISIAFDVLWLAGC